VTLQKRCAGAAVTGGAPRGAAAFFFAMMVS
jgi:hypothetical protein